jgi:hypothetical protein
MCATMGLYDPVFRGYGPSTLELKSLLEGWAATAPALAADTASLDVASVKGVLPVIEESYTDQSAASGDGLSGRLEQRALSRLLGLVQWKKAVDIKSLDDYDKAYDLFCS